MKISAIIQARIGSTRLNSKILKKIYNMSLLEHIIQRISGIDLIDDIIIATTLNSEDDKVEELFLGTDVKVFRGSEDNVLERFYLAAKKYCSDVIVRVTSDDPFKDPEIITKAIEELICPNYSYDYVSNTIEPTYPEGLDIEVFTYNALEKAYKEASLDSEKEHVTPYIWKNSDKFRIKNFTYKDDLSKLRWTIDYESDLIFAKKIYQALYPIKEIFLMQDILNIIDKDNIMNETFVERNEGYNNSMKKEETIMKRVSDLERKYVLEVLDTDFRTSKGAEFMTRFESKCSEVFQSKYAISHVNGTATMHSALEAMNIGAGDEVIVPPLTMSSTSLVVLQANATPVFTDVDLDTFLIDASSIEKNITDKTKAIITVSLYGGCPEMDKIMEIAKKYNLYVIEDNAQAFLSYYKGKLIGTYGDCSSFSYQSSKHLTSGEGGVITTNDENLAIGIRKVSGLGYSTIGSKKAKISKDEIQHPSFERHDYLGWNYRMSELNCAVALAQMERIEELVNLRKRNAKILLDAVEGCIWLKPQKNLDDSESSYWAFTCKLDIDKISWEEFREKFLEFGGSKYYGAWQLTYLEPLFLKKIFASRKSFITREYTRGLCPNAEFLQPRLIQLKTNFICKDDAVREADILRKTINYFNKKLNIES
jgi:perosamine synthetase